MIRPFAASAGVGNRQYSLPLEEAITDFGATTPFAKVAEKIRRHYGIDLSSSAAYVVTNTHAQAMAEFGVLPEARTEAAVLIAEMDGSMVPVVQMAAPHREAADQPDDNAPVRACYRYLTNRLDQLDYQGALANNLPIGSGEIESSAGMKSRQLKRPQSRALLFAFVVCKKPPRSGVHRMRRRFLF